MDFVDQIGASINPWDLEEKEKLCSGEDICILVNVGISLSSIFIFKKSNEKIKKS